MKHMLKLLVKNLYLSRKFHVMLSKSSLIGISSVFEGKNRVGKNTVFDGYMGRCSYIGNNAWLECVKIGRYCAIANGVSVATGRHPMNMVSQHPMFYSTAKQNGYTYIDQTIYEERIFADAQKKYDVVIENDVWIGLNAVLIGGVKIGNGAVIAAGAVVTKDVPDYAVVAGVPARIIRYRFDNQQIQMLLHDAWWNKDEIWLKNHTYAFSGVDEYLSVIKKSASEELNDE